MIRSWAPGEEVCTSNYRRLVVRPARVISAVRWGGSLLLIISRLGGRVGGCRPPPFFRIAFRMRRDAQEARYSSHDRPCTLLLARETCKNMLYAAVVVFCL